jgi:hypothetical protein
MRQQTRLWVIVLLTQMLVAAAGPIQVRQLHCRRG